MPKNSLLRGKKQSADTRRLLLDIYQRLLSYFGHRNWWPAGAPFEMVIGAILTQNTNWANVERALINLKKEKLLKPEKLAEINLHKLEKLIRPSGYFRQKAKRIKDLVKFFNAPPIDGSFEKMRRIPTDKMREMLLTVNGIGPETADSILLYALEKPVFVVDSYTRRIFAKLGLVPEDIKYDDLKAFFEGNLPRSVDLYNDFHAQIVALGALYCKKRAQCNLCPLGEIARCK